LFFKSIENPSVYLDSMRESRIAVDSSSTNPANPNVNPLADYMLLMNCKFPEIPDQYFSGRINFCIYNQTKRLI